MQEGKVPGSGGRVQRKGLEGLVSSGGSWMPGICQPVTMEGTSNHWHHRGYPETTGGCDRVAGRGSITVDLDEES